MNARVLALVAMLSFLFQTGAQNMATNALSLNNANTNRATRADVLRLLAVTQADVQLKSLLPQVLDQLKRGLPDVPPAEWRELEKELKSDEILALAIPIYERHLTADEIKGLIAFYETPLGKKTVEKLPAITTETMQAGMEWGERLGARLATNSGRAVASQKPNATRPQHDSPRREPIPTYTPESDRQALRNLGFNPDEWEFGPSSQVQRKIKEQPKPQAVTIAATNSTPSWRYWVEVNNGNASESYFSNKKPKQSGGSYIVQDIRGFEVTVTGNVRIIDTQSK